MMSPARLIALRSLVAYLTLACAAFALVPGSAQAATVLAALVIFLSWADLRTVGRVIASLMVLVSLYGLVRQPDLLLSASESMAGITGLILSVMLLSAVLGTSKDLAVISESLFGGRPVARYLGLSTGTGVLSIPLNFGSVGLIATMIGSQISQSGDSPAARNAARAVIRGFGASPMGSPLSIAVVMTVTLLPGLHSWTLLTLSLPFALLYLVAGVWSREQETPRSGPAETVSAFWPWMRFLAIVLFICVSAFALSTWGSLKYSLAVTLSCLSVVVLCLLYRRLVEGALALPSLANVNNELAIMGGSSFLGGALAMLALNSLGADFSLPSWGYPVLAFAIPWLFFCGGAVGVNPIISATVYGGILGPIWPEPALLALGLGLVTGWGITIAGTPYSSNSLLLERCTGYSAHQASYDWSRQYSLLMLTLSSGLCALIALMAPAS